MHGRRPPSFFLTKKKLADAGEVDGLINPFDSSSSIYAFMPSDSGCDRGKTLPLSRLSQDPAHLAQSRSRCRGSCEALVLLKASMKSWYSEGTPGIGESSIFWVGHGEVCDRLVSKQFCWQESDHISICLVVHEIWGLCLSSQGRPRMMGFWGESMVNRRMVSVWSMPVRRHRLLVMNLTYPVPKGRPSKAATATRDTHGTRGRLWVLANLTSMKLPAAPESIIATVSVHLPLNIMAMGTSRLLIESGVELRAAGWVGQEALRWPDRPQ